MPHTPPPDDPMLRIEGLLTRLLLAVQDQSMDIARIQDEITALRKAHADEIARLQSEVIVASQRADWFHVQVGDVLRVILRELREVRATQVFAAISDGPISAQTLADLVHRPPDDDLLLELPPRPVTEHGCTRIDTDHHGSPS
jgi:hypothetical protein